jgi:hypothetical protein
MALPESEPVGRIIESSHSAKVWFHWPELHYKQSILEHFPQFGTVFFRFGRTQAMLENADGNAHLRGQVALTEQAQMMRFGLGRVAKETDHGISRSRP